MSAKPWNEHRPTITKLYIQEGRTLEDVRVIMMTEHNFEASIRSYRQHFDIWDIGKYNCKKRQQRRRQILNRAILPAPLRSTTALSIPSETFDPGSSPVSSCASLRASEQVPLPAIRQPPGYAPSPHFGTHHLLALRSSSPPEPRIKIENGGGEMDRMGIPMYRRTAPPPPQSMLRSRVPSSPSTNPKKPPSRQERTSPFRRDAHYAYAYAYAYAHPAHWPVHRAPPPPSSTATPRTTTPGHHNVTCLIPPSAAIWYQDFVPPNMAGEGAWKPWCLASPFGQSLCQVP
ncbi:Clr5 domain-containing protein [Fusarium sp. LHS14.1]|nr:Clr5 domain-containing protein [Fusarium sp. LHS14.1]